MRGFLVIALFVFGFSLGKAQVNDTINFENLFPISNNSVIIIDSMDGVWQVGPPNKTIFNSTISGTNVLVTDTINPYPINQDSYFYFHIDDFASYLLTQNDCNGYINFDFKSDLDYLNDFVQLEIFSYGVWDTLTNGEYYEEHVVDWDFNYFVPNAINFHPTFTGTENNWQHVRLNLTHWYVFSPEDLQRGGTYVGQFRFHFHSDNIFDSKDGFMIDNLIFENYTAICVGAIHETQSQLQLSVYPTLTDNQISFETESEKFSKIHIYDFSGKLIEQFSFTPTNFQTLQLSKLPNGLYFYSVDEGKATGKFIIEK